MRITALRLLEVVSTMVREQTKDTEIRKAFHEKRLKKLRVHPETIIVDELGLAHAKSRIDIAVINGCIHGYEIKSALDTLDRLETQLEIYQQTLQRLTFVLSPKHVAAVMDRAPEWTGIIVATKGPRQGVVFKALRRPALNPEVNPVMMAHLLWRSEAVQLLTDMGFTDKALRGSRIQLYELLCSKLTAKQITTHIRQCMINRLVWRDPSPQALYGG